MAKILTIEDIRTSLSINYNLPGYSYYGDNNGGNNSGKGGKCDFTKYYENPMEILNYDPVCAFNNIPEVSYNINNFEYRNSLEILNNVSKKISEKRNDEVYGKGIDYLNHNNFIYYDESNKPRIR